MKRIFLLALSLVAAGAMAPCGATIVTIDPMAHRVGTDISTSYSGVILRRIASTPGATTYQPTVLPALVGACTYGPCPEFAPLRTVGGNTYGEDYFDCYRLTVLAPGSSSTCGSTWSMLELNFPNGTDFVEVDSVWGIDPPSIVAYDDAGNEVAFCRALGPGSPIPDPGSPAGCLVAEEFGPGGPLRGVSRVQTASPVIRRVVVGSANGTSYATGVQYNRINPRKPVCPTR